VNPKLMRVCEPGDELHDPSGLRLVFVDTPSASEGRRLELEWHVPPGARLVAADHYHPDGPERWTVIEGSARHRLDGAERAAPAPAQWVVEASTPHGHPWNAGDRELVVRQLIDTGERPMAELTGGVQGFFETLFAFTQRGELTPDGEIRGRLQNTLTIHDLLVPGTFLAGPPRFAQRAVLGAVATLARARGLRAYHRPEIARSPTARPTTGRADCAGRRSAPGRASR
jgi:quercetin dioxygenase-like cupin family protein